MTRSVGGANSPEGRGQPLSLLRRGQVSLRTTSQALRASSPGRGASGEPVVAVLDEQSFSRPETTGLRGRDSRQLAKRPLLEHCSAVAAHSDRARRFAPNWVQANSRAHPACQCLALRERWQREALTERGSHAAAANGNRARRFAPNWVQANSRAYPACQGLPLWGSCHRR